MNDTSLCQYRKIKSSPYEDDWESECGQVVVCEAPMQIGISFSSHPSFKFCPNCGKEVIYLLNNRAGKEK